MVSYSSNEFKAGLKILIDGAPCVIIENEFVKPGKGQAFTRVKYRNLHSGKVLEKTFRSTESVEGADVQDLEADFLYADDSQLHFMNPEDFEQYTVDVQGAGDVRYWLQPQTRCSLTLHGDRVLAVTPPNFVELRVVDTAPGVKGDTVTGGTKPATLDGGGQVDVPLFVSSGDMVRIDTRTGDYVSRIKG